MTGAAEGVRPDPGGRRADCAASGDGVLEMRLRPCRRGARLVDVFEIDGGRYLGEVLISGWARPSSVAITTRSIR